MVKNLYEFLEHKIKYFVLENVSVNAKVNLEDIYGSEIGGITLYASFS